MRNISMVGARPPPSAPPATGPVSSSSLLSGSSATIFQKSGSSGLSGLASRSYGGAGSPTLSSQMASTLMQEQDINQQVQGHGGGHGGSMKMIRNLEAEEAAGTEETKQTQKRKKLVKAGQLEDMKEAVELDKNGDPIAPDSGQKTEKRERSIWDWL